MGKKINIALYCKQTLEKTGNIESIRHMTKTNKTKHTTQKAKKISNTDPINTGTHEGQAIIGLTSAYAYTISLYQFKICMIDSCPRNGLLNATLHMAKAYQ